MCGLSAVVAFTGNFLPDEWLDIPAAGLFVFLVTVWPAYRLRSRYALETRRRELRPMTAETVQSSDRAPVLYLRSFEDDQRGARIKGSLTEEEHLAKVLSQFGPFVAIGRPGEALPEAGATRVYVGDANWQSTVEELLGNANMVIVRTGRTVGLDWEVERAVRILRPQQLVLLVDNARELRNILERISHVHPQVRTRIRIGWRSIGSIRGFILFDDGGGLHGCGREDPACTSFSVTTGTSATRRKGSHGPCDLFSRRAGRPGRDRLQTGD